MQFHSGSFGNDQGEISVRVRAAIGRDGVLVYTFEGESLCHR